MQRQWKEVFWDFAQEAFANNYIKNIQYPTNTFIFGNCWMRLAGLGEVLTLATSLIKKTMTKLILFFLFLLTTNSMCGQTLDTIYFTGFKGIVYDSLTAPRGSEKVFPKNRFNPTTEQIMVAEEQIVKQYGEASRKVYALQGFLYNSDYYRELSRKEPRKENRRIRREYRNYDREYYGYIGKNNMRYIFIKFYPHKRRWVHHRSAGESQLYNLPPLVFNLDNNTLSWYGWTGEFD